MALIVGCLLLGLCGWGVIAVVRALGHRGCKKQIASAEARAQDAERRLAKLQRGIQYFYQREHRVFLDGEKSAGKSALVAKLVNPASDIRALKSTTGWVGLQQFLCDEPFKDPQYPENQAIRRHVLGYYDVPGETPQQLQALAEEQAPEAVIFVVDGTLPEASLSRFSNERIIYFYGAKHIREKIVASVIYVSKSDVLGDGVAQQIEEYVRKNLVPLLQKAGLSPTIVFGSALTGERLPDVWSAIVTKLGVDEWLPHHDSVGLSLAS